MVSPLAYQLKLIGGNQGAKAPLQCIGVRALANRLKLSPFRRYSLLGRVRLAPRGGRAFLVVASLRGKPSILRCARQRRETSGREPPLSLAVLP